MSKMKNQAELILSRVTKEKIAPIGIHGRMALFPWPLETVEERISAAFKFARERHNVFLRRAAGLPAPWTQEYVMQNYRFCNIYREIDKVSLWIRDNIITPYEDSPHLWHMLCFARTINLPSTLDALIKTPGAFPIDGKWNPDKTYEVMTELKKKGPIFTGAYIINSCYDPATTPEKMRSKHGFITYRTLGLPWKDRKTIGDRFKTTLEEAVSTLREYPGYGPFIAYQVVVDLTYSKKWLGNAVDLNTFTSPGPGTCKGANFIMNGNTDKKINRKDVDKVLQLMLRRSRDERFWPVNSKDPLTGFAPLTMSNMSNVFCEFSKIASVYEGSRTRLKNTYAANGTGKAVKSTKAGKDLPPSKQRRLF